MRWNPNFWVSGLRRPYLLLAVHTPWWHLVFKPRKEILYSERYGECWTRVLGPLRITLRRPPF